MPSSVRPAPDSSLRHRSAPPEELTLHDWPLRDRPLPSSVAMTIAVSLSWLAGWATDNWIIAALVATALLVTLWRTWLPVSYELGPSGITQIALGLRRRISWLAIRSHQIRDDGVLLLPDDDITPLSPLRGLYLHWGNHQTAVLTHLRHYLPPQ